ncbi:hypothetical protein HFP57_05205 [Parasphingopyxis algicola]|uniref:hypothetical protein n=1 Tax=Parasphingopyxis algicola TaxID=2026624 RepID=UPI0015A4A954|nr:hypothetical protein [Parasphingopyxis algicola]QLC24477.1 hypothetical protein HFP57_05205 [Parasphingopyxis algicola]
MRYSALIAALVFILMPGKALADCSGVFCNDVLVQRIVVSATATSVRTSGDETQLDCDPGTGLYLTMDNTDPEYNDSYALVLTAFVSGTPMTFRMESGTGPCTVSYVLQDR